MANTDSSSNEKNLITRRTLLNNGILTGLSLAAGFYLTNASNIPVTMSLKKESKGDLKNSDDKSKKDTYIDNFDC